jgi:pimeloyl-ACP methyl ester carboxylesterase
VLEDPRYGRIVLHGPLDAPGPGDPVLLVHSVNAAAGVHELTPLWERLSRGRPAFALDLPGFGASERAKRPYDIRTMCDAVAAAAASIGATHRRPIAAVGLSLSCEFIARIATESPETFSRIVLISPTGLSKRPMRGPRGTHRGSDAFASVLGVDWIGRPLFRNLVRPSVVRYFLRRTFGADTIDETLWTAAVAAAGVAGAEHAPLRFLSGHLFGADATDLYEAITAPVWVAHGSRGDFVDYRHLDRLVPERPSWTRTVYPGGAMPHFEDPDGFASQVAQFLEGHAPSNALIDK